jgi:L-fuculose-phosphate aldolase
MSRMSESAQQGRTDMTNEWQLRQTICEVGRRLYRRGFAAANDGNITVRLGENRFLCTPTGVSKGFMKPEELAIIDGEGKQISGPLKRSSEALLHLTIYKERPDVNGVLHCHPPHTCAFAVAQEPIPKCVLPEVEVFLGEVPIARYETPGTQQFADTVVPFLHDSNIIVLANHGTVAFAADVMKAYFNTEILDAYCRILLLARQLGPINYLGERHVAELLEFKRRLGIDDPRLHMQDCDLCGNSIFRTGYDSFVPRPTAFPAPVTTNSCAGPPPRPKPNSTSPEPKTESDGDDLEVLVQTITDQVLESLSKR